MGITLKCVVMAVGFLLVAPGSGLYAQRTDPPTAVKEDTARGIKLFQQGDTIGAIEALRTAVKQHKEDAEAWYYLGLALVRGGHSKSARKAFEAAVKLRPEVAETHVGLSYTLLLANKTSDAGREAELALKLNWDIAEAHYILGTVRFREKEMSNSLKEAEEALRIKPDFAPAHLLKSQTLVGVFLKEAEFRKALASNESYIRDRWRRLHDATESLERYLALTNDPAEIKMWRSQLDSLRVYAGGADQPGAGRNIYLPNEVTTRPNILNRVEPEYTEEARKEGVEGKVTLLAELTADGKVKNILVLQWLPAGLTQRAIYAASQIKFEPAIKDGRPVSVAIQIDYNFNLY